jgi:hypothetical protein
MPIDVIILCFLSAISVLAVYIKVIRDQHSGKSGNDGGLAEEIDFPELDLPPGVTLPIDGPRVKRDEEILV